MKLLSDREFKVARFMDLSKKRKKQKLTKIKERAQYIYLLEALIVAFGLYKIIALSANQVEMTSLFSDIAKANIVAISALKTAVPALNVPLHNEVDKNLAISTSALYEILDITRAECKFKNAVVTDRSGMNPIDVGDVTFTVASLSADGKIADEHIANSMTKLNGEKCDPVTQLGMLHFEKKNEIISYCIDVLVGLLAVCLLVIRFKEVF